MSGSFKLKCCESIGNDILKIYILFLNDELHFFESICHEIKIQDYLSFSCVVYEFFGIYVTGFFELRFCASIGDDLLNNSYFFQKANIFFLSLYVTKHDFMKISVFYMY